MEAMMAADADVAGLSLKRNKVSVVAMSLKFVKWALQTYNKS